MNRERLHRLYRRIRDVELVMDNHSVYVNDVTGIGCCLLDHACILAVQDGIRGHLTVDVVCRWLGMSWGDLLECGWFGSENSSEVTKKLVRKELKRGVTKHLYASTSVS